MVSCQTGDIALRKDNRQSVICYFVETNHIFARGPLFSFLVKVQWLPISRVTLQKLYINQNLNALKQKRTPYAYTEVSTFKSSFWYSTIFILLENVSSFSTPLVSSHANMMFEVFTQILSTFLRHSLSEIKSPCFISWTPHPLPPFVVFVSLFYFSSASSSTLVH